jgi:alpha-tubulin suppressor-like RCC1 family protein
MLRRPFGINTGMPRFITLLSFGLTILVAQVAFAQSRVSGGDNFTLLVADSGSVWAFGNNSSGQLGLGHTNDAKSPTQIPNLSGVIAVAAGGFHSLALTSTGDLYAWGGNVNGQVGDESNTNRSTPQLLDLSDVVAIAAGERHSLALTGSGDLYAWGENDKGQLGTGNTTDSNIPVLILSGVSAIGAGLEHSLAVKTNGTAWAWGKNAGGQLSNNAVSSGATSTPAQMIGISGAVAVYGGAAHSVIRLSNGTLKATGQNGDGQLGDGTTASQRLTAVAVVGLTNIEAVAVGSFHNLALDDDGVIWVWGDGSKGAIGTGNQTDVNTPAALSAPTNVEYIGVSWEHSVAIDANGVVSTWGANGAGELGDGTTVPRWAPDAITSSGYSWRVATPTFSVAANTYNTEKSVTVAVDTIDATIRYTIDGTDPTTSSWTIASGSSVTIDQSRTLKAKAWKTGMPDSAIKSAVYTLQALTPSITIPSGGPFSSTQTVSMSTGTSDSTIRYTLDGTNPTSSSTAYNSTTQLPLDQTATIKSATFKTGWSASGVQTGTITFNYGALDAPTISPATGNYAGTASVTMSSSQSGATIRYTTNGSTPTASSTAYSSAIPISQTTTVKAKAFHSSYNTSPETSRTYTMSAATPTLSVAAGSYAPGDVVTISTTEPTATLRMTIDGNDPTSTSPIVASGTSMLLGNFTLKVKAFRSGVGDSAIANAAYTLTSALGPGAVTTGGAHNVMTTPDGRVYAWGNNFNGQLGNESTTDRQTPTLINTITGVKAVASGLAHTLALRADGLVYAWGSNGSGRLGNGSTDQSTRPVPVSTLSNVVAIAAGDTHSLALTSDGHVYSWGANNTGQLGLGNSGTGTEQIVPTQVTTLSNIVAIAAGDSQSFAVTSGGQVYAWGANGNSRLGDGGTSQRDSPYLLGLSNIVSIAAGQAHTLALTSGGRVYGWGANSNGQLGIAATATVATATLIPNLHVSAIVAGDNHSGVIRADGALVMFGNSSSGQVGSGSITATIATPTVISGVSSASSLSLGDLHSVAVTSTGDVWAWGESADYRLGNSNSSQDKSSPQSILTGLTTWAPAAPTINVASGTLGATTTVTLTSSTSGAVIRYTLNGATPTGTDAEAPANGQIEISYSSLLRARAFVTGRQAVVAPARADYELQSAPPVISPGTGTYNAAQTVSITATGAPGAIRYTLDGSEPTGSSSLYSSPLGVSGGTTIKAKTFPSNGWAASTTATAMLTFNLGTLAAPSASPSPGVFATEPQVTLSSIAGASIRYTLNGTTPTASSTLYTGAITIPSAGATLKSIAFHPDWTASSIRSDTYTIDTVVPTITSSRFPAAIGSWHNAPTTVSFVCADNVGIASCSAPSAFTSEGQGQSVVGTALDQAGREATANVTVNIDLTPPEVELTSPEGTSTTTATSITLRGDVSDQLSGLSNVTCNGQTATVVNGEVNCDVPLAPGINDIVLAARDVAGNSTSAAVRVTRTGISTVLALTPAMKTLEVEEVLTLKLTDDFGAAITGATWASSDSEIVSVSADDPPVLTGLAAGTASITATKGALSAVATLVVVADPLPYGTTRWTVNGLFDAAWIILPANRVALTVPDIFSFEPGATGTLEDMIVRGVTSNGEVEWVAQSPGYPLMADSFGGVVVGTAAQPSNAQYWGPLSESRYGGFVRLAGPTAVSPWRYDSDGRLERPAQARDGTIYALDKYDTGLTDVHGTHIIETHVIVLDGATGQLRSKIPLQREIQGYGCGNDGWTFSPRTVGPVIGNDGYGYVLVRNVTNIRSGGCGMTSNVSQDVGVKLLRISPAGESSYTVIYAQHCDHPFTTSITICDEEPNLGQLLPDGIGGILVTYGYTVSANQQGSPIYTMEARLARITPEGIQYNMLYTDSEIKMTDNSGRAFVSDVTSTRVVNVTNWSTLVSIPNPALVPVATLTDGRFALHDLATGTLYQFAADGTPIQSAQFGGGHQSAFGLFTKVPNPMSPNPIITAEFSSPLDEKSYSFYAGEGSGSQQNAPEIPAGTTDQDDTAIILMRYLLGAPGPVDAFGFPFEQAGLVCKEADGLQYNIQPLGVGTASSAPGLILVPEQCTNGTTVGSAHTHPGQFRDNEYPSGYRSEASYFDVDENPANGLNRSDLWIADDYFDNPSNPSKPYIGPNGPNVMWYVTSQKGFFVKYKKTASGPAKDNIRQFNYATHLWGMVTPKW